MDAKKKLRNLLDGFVYLLVFLGGVLFLKNFGLLNFSWREFGQCWPLFLLFGGISLIPAKNWLKQIVLALCVIGAWFVLWNAPAGVNSQSVPTSETPLLHSDCKTELPKTVTTPTLILDVSLENLTDGLIDRSAYDQPNIGGISGLSEHDEGGLIPSQQGGSVPKWVFNRPIASFIYEIEAKLFSISGHSEVFCFVRSPEDNSPCGLFLTCGGYNKLCIFGGCKKTSDVKPTIPLNIWTKIRVEVSAPIDGKIAINLYFDDVLKISTQSDYSEEVFPHMVLTPDFGFAYHDRANAALRNLKVWITQ
jgi:hypothetical protein